MAVIVPKVHRKPACALPPSEVGMGSVAVYAVLEPSDEGNDLIRNSPAATVELSRACSIVANEFNETCHI